MPSGRVLPSPWGRRTRRPGRSRYVLVRSSSSHVSRHCRHASSLFPACRAAAVLHRGYKTGSPVQPWLCGKARLAASGLSGALLSGRKAFPLPPGHQPVLRGVRVPCPKCPAFARRRFSSPAGHRYYAELRLLQPPAPASVGSPPCTASCVSDSPLEFSRLTLSALPALSPPLTPPSSGAAD